MRSNVLEVVEKVQQDVFNTITKNGIKFKQGKPIANLKRMSIGNKKLYNILIFDLLAGKQGSCEQNCYKCYAIKSQRQYSRTNLYRSVNYMLAKKHLNVLKELLILQLKYTNQETVRIHSSGEFFSQEYLNMWTEIVELFPEIKFYAYTKMTKKLYFDDLTSNKNFNLINSIALIDNKEVLNYGDKTHIANLIKNNWFLCPATVKNGDNIRCGLNCTYCITNNKVCFNIH